MCARQATGTDASVKTNACLNICSGGCKSAQKQHVGSSNKQAAVIPLACFDRVAAP